ncbi:unnamed protein product [Calypogeia fissa]
MGTYVPSIRDLFNGFRFKTSVSSSSETLRGEAAVGTRTCTVKVKERLLVGVNYRGMEPRKKLFKFLNGRKVAKVFLKQMQRRLSMEERRQKRGRKRKMEKTDLLVGSEHCGKHGLVDCHPLEPFEERRKEPRKDAAEEGSKRP